MTDAPAGNGLKAILPALVVASALGYAVQLVVPIFTAPAVYVGFAAFWSALFLCVAAFSGVQQEVARSTSRVPGGDAGTRRALARFALVVVAAAVVVGAVVGIVLSATLLQDAAAAVVPSLALGVAGYGLLALGAGVLYGAGQWRGAAVAAVADPALRAVGVGLVVGVAWFLSSTADAAALIVACSLPFALGAAIVWRWSARVVDGIRLDAGVAGLVRHSLHTVVAALALGLIVSGLPLLVGILGRGHDASFLAGVVFLVVLARAPLVSPLLALQSYLTVRFVQARGRLLRPVAVLAGVVALGAALLALAIVLLAPFVFGVVVPAYQAPPTWLVVVIVGSAGLVAVQCITGPAVLSQGRHAAYSAGWVVTALGTLSSLVLPLPFEAGLVVALVAGPILGIAVHGAALAVRGRTEAPG